MSKADMLQALLRRGVSPAVRERIDRLNSDFVPGQKVRGWNPAPTLWRQIFSWDVIGRREFLRRFGRCGWANLPKSAIIKDGKRRYVRTEAVQDQLYLPRAA